MIKVGLTGGMGSGKSIVGKIFNVIGIPVLDADYVAKSIMTEDETLKKKIISIFGNSAYLDSGALNRKYIADIVFKQEHKLDQLNAIVHPATISFADNWMQQQQAPYAIKEAALIFESGSAGHLDYIIGVFAPKHIRINRIIKRDNTSKEQILARMDRQVDDAIKIKLCDFVINNDEQQLVTTQVLQIHYSLLNAVKEKSRI